MSEAAFASLTLWEYRDTAIPPPAPPPKAPEVSAPVPVVGFTEEQVQARIRGALTEAEQRWAGDAAAREIRCKEQMKAALEGFVAERTRYFRDAEREIVQLTLAIARKILHREALLDPELLAALVRIALEQMGAGSAVRLRVHPLELARWQQPGPAPQEGQAWEVVADARIESGGCRVETDMGVASFGFEVQLKEIERGMLDLLEARPLLPAFSAAEAQPAAEAL